MSRGRADYSANCRERNLSAFLLHLVKDGKLVLNRNDEIIRETLLTTGGDIVNARVLEFFGISSEPKETPK